MYFEKPIKTGIVHDSTHLRELIAENPDLPIVVLSDDESCIGDGVNTYMSEVNCYVGELLDCYPIKFMYDDDRIFDDPVEFKEYIQDYICDEFEDKSDAEQDKIVEQYLKLCEPYWKKCIIIKASN